jgi:hypothetical protein
MELNISQQQYDEAPSTFIHMYLDLFIYSILIKVNENQKPYPEDYFLSAVATLCSTYFPRAVTPDVSFFNYYKHTLESRNCEVCLLKIFEIN